MGLWWGAGLGEKLVDQAMRADEASLVGARYRLVSVRGYSRMRHVGAWMRYPRSPEHEGRSAFSSRPSALNPPISFDQHGAGAGRISVASFRKLAGGIYTAFKGMPLPRMPCV